MKTLDAINLITNKLPHFGTNKSREILRLLYEISQTEKEQINVIVDTLTTKDYESTKKVLLKRRYPKTFEKVPLRSFYLPKYEVSKDFKVVITNKPFYPTNIYYESQAMQSNLFENIRILFPNSRYNEIESLKSFVKDNSFSLKDYNNRCNNLFLVKEKYDF
jgi:spore photoproduct lyase